ncbi:MAG: glycosyltransferase [Pseudomonadota bacterium]
MRISSSIEVHSIRPSICGLLLGLGLLSRTAFYDHNHSRRFGQTSGAQRRLIVHCLGRAAEVRLVSEHLREHYADLAPAPRLTVIEPEVAPDTSKRESIVAGYPDWVRAFWDEGTARVILGAWRPSFVGDRDLYGLVDAVAMAPRLAADHDGFRMLLTVADPLDGQYVRDLQRAIDNSGLGLKVRILTGQYQMWPLVEQAELLLRPTLTDGNSVSILEAQHLGTPVLASDCVQRPGGVATFPTGDAEAMARAVDAVLRGADGGPTTPDASAPDKLE